MEQKKFQESLSYAHSDHDRDVIMSSEGDHLFEKGDYVGAATSYAKSTKPFEEISLLFLAKQEKNALKRFVRMRLDMQPATAKTQRTVLSVWLIEIYLDCLNAYTKDSKEWNEAIAEIHGFLQTYRTNLDQAKSTVFHLISSHGRVEILLFYANLIEDYDRVITHHLQRGDYMQVIQTFKSLIKTWKSRGNPPQSIKELFYKHSHVLMEERPKDMIDVCIEAKFVDPSRIIPALVRYSQQKHKRANEEDQAIRYLEHCIKVERNNTVSLHNFLLSLLADEASDEASTKKLHDFILSSEANFDPKYALRICSERRKDYACVLIYSSMKLYEEAVSLALKMNDLDLAKYNAGKSDSFDTQRRLWKHIAKHVLSQTNKSDRSDVGPVSKILEESNGALKIEDLLPMIPDLVKIDDVKDSVCASLEEYNAKIQGLRREMEEHGRNAELIRQDIKAQQTERFERVRGSRTCDLCSDSIFVRPFFVFPCTHTFHTDCLTNEVKRNLSGKRKEQLETLLKELSESVGGKGTQSMQSRGLNAEVKAKVDDITSSSCPFCGDMMIQSIAKGFVTQNEEKNARLWDI